MKYKLWKFHHMIWSKNIFWYRGFLSWKADMQLKMVARYIRKKHLYPVNLDERLLNIWEGKK